MNFPEWKPVTGYEGYYEVSSSGTIRSLRRIIKMQNGNNRLINERIMKPRINNCGYLFITLCKDGNKKYHYVHRLVAHAFIPNPNNLPQVNHLKSKHDNTPADLEWSDAKNNTLHSYSNNLNSNQGANHPFAVGIIDNDLGQKYDTIKAWCIARGIKYSTGRNILSGCNTSKTISMTDIVLIKKSLSNGQVKSR